MNWRLQTFMNKCQREGYWIWKDRSLLRKEAFSMPFHLINKYSLRISMGSASIELNKLYLPLQIQVPFFSVLLCVPGCHLPQPVYEDFCVIQSSTWSQWDGGGSVPSGEGSQKEKSRYSPWPRAVVSARWPLFKGYRSCQVLVTASSLWPSQPIQEYWPLCWDTSWILLQLIIPKSWSHLFEELQLMFFKYPLCVCPLLPTGTLTFIHSHLLTAF